MIQPQDTVILVVDDDEMMRKAISNDFKRKGYQVLTASNGKEAFELVKTQKVDVVLSDVRMAGGDGIELLKQIREFNPGVPVVMLITGFADISLEEAYHLGADAVFSKPFDRKALFGAVERSVTPKSERWLSREPRIDVDFKIELHFPELKIAVEARVLNIGRGGIFVALTGTLPDVGAQADFKIAFDQGPPRAIGGNGIVRWIRPRAIETGNAGCGIEFVFIDDDGRAELITLIDSLGVKAFIPKS